MQFVVDDIEVELWPGHKVSMMMHDCVAEIEPFNYGNPADGWHVSDIAINGRSVKAALGGSYCDWADAIKDQYRHVGDELYWSWVRSLRSPYA